MEDSDTQVFRVQPVKSGPKSPKEGLERYLGSSLWMNLSDEASVLFSHRCLNRRGRNGEYVPTD
jgi:hypothetical protein